MKLEVVKNRLCVVESPEGLNFLETIKLAYAEGIMPRGRKVFGSPWSRAFSIRYEDVLKTYCYRENWNGYHDVEIYSLPDFAPIGVKTMADYSIGLHRNTVTVPE